MQNEVVVSRLAYDLRRCENENGMDYMNSACVDCEVYWVLYHRESVLGRERRL